MSGPAARRRGEVSAEREDLSLVNRARSLVTKRRAEADLFINDHIYIVRSNSSIADTLTMLYELVAIVRTGNINYVKDIARTTGRQILQAQGTIRNINNYGVFDLPKPTTKYQTRHHKGHYFTLLFDSSSQVQDEVRRQLSLNPHMIRFSFVKIGDKLGGRRNQSGKIEDVTGKMEWNSSVDNSIQKKVSASNLFATELKTDLPRSQYQAKDSAYSF